MLRSRALGVPGRCGAARRSSAGARAAPANVVSLAEVKAVAAQRCDPRVHAHRSHLLGWAQRVTATQELEVEGLRCPLHACHLCTTLPCTAQPLSRCSELDISISELGPLYRVVCRDGAWGWMGGAR